jgi:hypothetical protein
VRTREFRGVLFRPRSRFPFINGLSCEQLHNSNSSRKRILARRSPYTIHFRHFIQQGGGCQTSGGMNITLLNLPISTVWIELSSGWMAAFRFSAFTAEGAGHGEYGEEQAEGEKTDAGGHKTENQRLDQPHGLIDLAVGAALDGIGDLKKDFFELI